MIAILRVWATAGVNIWWSTDTDTVDEIHKHIAQVITAWESAPHWSKISDMTWKNTETGARIELLHLKDTAQ